MNNKYIIPPINSKGRYTVAPPFDTVFRSDIEYKVIAIRSITELLSEDIDVYSLIYQPVGLTEDDMNEDLTNNVPIITFQSESGTLLYIPASYITSIPLIAGKIFTQKIIAINLGLVPEDLNLDAVVEDVTDYVQSLLGIQPSTEVIDTSQRMLYSYEEYDKYEQKRLSGITNKETFRSKWIKCTQLLEQYKLKVKLLLKKLDDCCST